MAIPKPDSQWGPGTRESNCIATDNGNGFVILRKPDTMSQNSWDYLVWAANNATKMYNYLKKVNDYWADPDGGEAIYMKSNAGRELVDLLSEVESE